MVQWLRSFPHLDRWRGHKVDYIDLDLSDEIDPVRWKRMSSWSFCS